MAFSVSMFLLIIGSLTYYFINQVSNSIKLISYIEDCSKDITKLRIAEENFLLIEQTNLFFLSSGKSNYLNAINTYYEKSLEWLKASKNNQQLSNKQLQITDINTNLKNHKKLLDNLIEAIKLRGYDKSGIVGQLDEIALKLNKIVDDEYITYKIKELRVSEKNYLLKKKDKFEDELIIKIDALKEDIQQYSKTDTSYLLDKQATSEFIKTLDLYKTKFKKLTDLDKKIGLDEKAGLKKEVRESIQKINNNVDNIVNQIKQDIDSQVDMAILIIILVICILIIVTIVIMVFFAGDIARPFELFRDYIIRLGKGELPERFTITSKAEIGEMANAINELTDNLKNTKEFVVEVGNGNLETEVNVFNNQGDLGGSLVKMRQELFKIAKEREKQEQEDEKRNWGTRGLALFNDILRQSSIKLDEIGFHALLLF